MQFDDFAGDFWPEEDLFERGRRVVADRVRRDCGVGARYLNCRLADFKPYPTQVEAFKAAKDFCENYLSGKNRGEGLLFAGNCGSGKTMLAASMAGEIIERGSFDDLRVYFAGQCGVDMTKKPSDPVKFVNIVDFLECMRRDFGDSDNNSTYATFEECKRVPLLFIDDLGAERPSGWAGERLYELINSRYMELLPIIVTTNCNADELCARLGDRLADRVKSVCRYVPIIVKNSLRRPMSN